MMTQKLKIYPEAEDESAKQRTLLRSKGAYPYAEKFSRSGKSNLRNRKHIHEAKEHILEAEGRP